jgi:hypothetical protein
MPNIDEKKLTEMLYAQAGEAARIEENMRQQGDMPTDAAFQDGVWNATQRIIRWVAEQPAERFSMAQTTLQIRRWENGYWETQSTYDADPASEMMARKKLAWYRETWTDRSFELARITNEKIA